MTTTDTPHSFEPRRPAIIASVVFLLVALSLMWPMLSGKVLISGDQMSAGYAFRAFFATTWHAIGHIPQWNPYVFGGMPLWAVPGHFDVFYPTAWLRWFMSADVVLTVAFFIHLFVAGLAMYALLRALRTSWGAALVGGVAYELTGILASQINPGHDGKLYVAALAPLAFLTLLRAIRHGRIGGYGAFALVIGLAMLSPHYQAAYYLMIAAGIFTLWLVFFDPDRRRDRSPIIPLAWATAAVVLGAGIAMIEVLPVLHSVQYTARAAGGDSTGWDYATSWSMPVEEVMTTILPQFNGMLDNYWGQNSFKDHTEYVGAIVLTLAILGFGVVRRRGLLAAFGTIGALFLLVAFGGHTPFYRLWYLLPEMHQFRAAGMAFYLTALAICIFAGFGADRVLSGKTNVTRLSISLGVIGLIAILGVGGILQSITESIANSISISMPAAYRQHTLDAVVANASALEAGSLRLLLVVIIGGGLIVLVHRRKVNGALAVAALVVAVAGDNWSILRNFGGWIAPASQSFVDDPITTAMKKTPLPFRVYDPEGQVGDAEVYQGANLMSFGVPQLFGYHGMEDRFFDELFGGKNVWTNQGSQTLWDLYAVKYVVVNGPVDSIVGFHKVMGPVAFTNPIGRRSPSGVLYQRDAEPEWVRVVPAAAKVHDDSVVGTVINPRFPVSTYVLLSDTASAQAPGANQPVPDPTPVAARLTSWVPGTMTVKLAGADTRPTWLVIAENWYPDWHATVDGKAVTPLRGDYALLTIPLPPGAKEVTLNYDVADYHKGMWITLASLVLAGLIMVGGRFGRRTADA
ncbi:MAG TPA: hypothetical protein VHW65_10380 [Gemmatimonadales bacterium]|nr:hypothetical protein [Gemmatimonadales bacterium]